MQLLNGIGEFADQGSFFRRKVCHTLTAGCRRMSCRRINDVNRQKMIQERIEVLLSGGRMKLPYEGAKALDLLLEFFIDRAGRRTHGDDPCFTGCLLWLSSGIFLVLHECSFIVQLY
ncbi:MAG: hypothetical protein RL213_654 [Bacteroidota bacterium]